MKSFASLLMSLVVSAAMLTGCGCTNQNTGMTTPPTSLLPTTEETTMATSAPTQATTMPTGESTTGTDETVNHGNGPLVEETTSETGAAAETTRPTGARQGMPIK